MTRLIDADALKEDLFAEFDEIASKSETGEWTLIPIKHIKQIINSRLNNAPAVIINTNDIEYKAYCKGLEDGRKIARRLKGEWIVVHDEKYGDNVKCPFCGKEIAGTDLNFCCKCGAELKGGAK